MAFNSKTKLEIVDVLCEGPIGGLVKGRKSIFLDESLVTKRDIDNKDVLFEEKKGGALQGSFQDFYDESKLSDQSSAIIQVSQEIGKNYSEKVINNEVRCPEDRDYGAGQFVRTITDSEADSVQLVFSIPRLFSTGVEGVARGQLFPAKIKFSVHIAGKGEEFRKITITSDNALREEGILDEDDNCRNIFTGISTNGYQFKTQPIRLADSQGNKKAPWKIKVKKINFKNPEEAFEIRYTDFRDLEETEPLQSGRANTFVWDYIVVNKKVQLSHKHTACVALSISSEQFNSLPARAYDVKGRLVRIPSNFGVRQDGSLYVLTESDQVTELPFNGELAKNPRWTTCPVCCFYDMITNPRYGAGDFINEDNISWIDLIEIAKYCNELVEVGTGTEPRFALNTVIATQADAYSVIQDLASVFRGLVYWRADTIQLAADHGNLDKSIDLDPIHVFNNSNVVGGGFVYSGSSLKTRSTRVVVRYNDPDNFYKTNYVIVEDLNAIKKYGNQTRETIAFGCTSKTQAQRMGKWILKTEELEGSTVAFSVGLEGLNVLPGQVFAVADTMRQGARLSGRVIGATRRFVITDSAISSPSGNNDKVTIVLPDGRVETRAVTSIVNKTIDVFPPFSEPPADGAVFALTDDSVNNQKFRCLSVAEGEDGVYSITGVEHNDSIYRVVESNETDLTFADVSIFDEKPLEPFGVKIEFFDVTQNLNRFKRIDVSWSKGIDAGGLADPRTISFQLEYRITASGNWSNPIRTNETSVQINDTVVSGQRFYVRIRAVGPEPNAKKSHPITSNAFVTADAMTTTGPGGTIQVLPPDPENVTLEPVGKDQVVFTWGATANGQDLREFLAVIRHSGKVDGTGEWHKSTLLRKVEARITSVTLPLLEGEYFVKFENASGLRSNGAASAVIDLPESMQRFNFETIQEASSNFPGKKIGVYYDDGYNGLILDGDAIFDIEVQNLDALSVNIDSIFGTQRKSGVYYFNSILDFGGKFSPLFRRVLDSTGTYTTGLIDSQLQLIDTWTDFDGDVADGTNVQMYLRASDLAPASGPIGFMDGDNILFEDNDKALTNSDTTFRDWILLENTNFAGRQFQFKAEFSTNHSQQTPVVQSLGVVAELEQRAENSNLITSIAGSTSVLFEHGFYTDDEAKVSVGIVAYNLLAEDYFELSEPTAAGFNITFKSSFDGSELVSRKFRYTAVGYGKQHPTP